MQNFHRVPRSKVSVPTDRRASAGGASLRSDVDVDVDVDLERPEHLQQLQRRLDSARRDPAREDLESDETLAGLDALGEDEAPEEASDDLQIHADEVALATLDLDPGDTDPPRSLALPDEDLGAGLLLAGLTGERAPPSPRSPEALERGADAFDRYLASVRRSRRLVREDETEIGERLRQTAGDLFEAARGAPEGVRALLALVDDVREGRAPLWEFVDVVTLETWSDAEALERFAQAAEGADLDSAASGPSPALHEDLRLRPAALRRIEAALDAAAGAGGEEAASARSARSARSALGAARGAFERTRAMLVEAYLPLVISVAKKHRERGLALGDLVQEGNVGLLRAAEKFDHRRGVRFGTYATWWIRQAIARGVINQGSSMRVPVRVFQNRGKVLRVRQAWLQERGTLPSPEELAARTGLRPAEVDAALDVLPEPRSLDSPIGEEARLGDFVASTAIAPDEAAESRALREHVPKLLDALDPRERFVLRMRFGIDEAEGHTLEEIGKVLSLSRERVRQIEAAALKKLRQAPAAKRLAG